MKKIAFATGGVLALTGAVRTVNTMALVGPAGVWFMVAPSLYRTTQVVFCVSTASLAVKAINNKAALAE